MSAGAQLYYRIPSGNKIKNPSKLLHKVAVRVDGSVWIVAQAGIPDAAAIVESLRAKGADAGLVYYREDQADAVRALAVEGLRAEVDDIAAQGEKKAARARALIADAERLQDAGALDAAVKHTRGKFRAALKRVQAAEQAAVLFGITADVADLLASLRDGIAAEQDAILGERALTPTAPVPAIGTPAEPIGGCPGCEAQAAAGAEPVAEHVGADEDCAALATRENAPADSTELAVLDF